MRKREKVLPFRFGATSATKFIFPICPKNNGKVFTLDTKGTSKTKETAVQWTIYFVIWQVRVVTHRTIV